MTLYHGTFKRNYEKIKQNNKIQNLTSSLETDIVNQALSRYADSHKLREGAIFLFDSDELCEKYDEVIIVKADELNKEKLFVGDYKLATEIYEHVISCKRVEMLRVLCESYVNNFISYEEYLTNKESITIPEFLYYKSIML